MYIHTILPATDEPTLQFLHREGEGVVVVHLVLRVQTSPSERNF